MEVLPILQHLNIRMLKVICFNLINNLRVITLQTLSLSCTSLVRRWLMQQLEWNAQIAEESFRLLNFTITLFLLLNAQDN